MKKTLCRVARAACVLGASLVLACASQAQSNSNHVSTSTAGGGGAKLETGAYLVLRESSTPESARLDGARHVVLPYDRRKYSEAPPETPLAYVAIDRADYIPLIIEGAPEMKSDGQGKSVLNVSLRRQYADRMEEFTRVHLGGRVAIVVDGEIVTLHKIRTVITGGKLQITRCTDNACEVIRAKLVK